MAEEKTKVSPTEQQSVEKEKKETTALKAADDTKELPKLETVDEEDEEIDADKLFQRRPSVALTPDNARFYRSAGGLISLDLIGKEETETFERVVVLRSFPITAPEEFLSVREPDTRKKGRGAEIGMIRHLSDFDEATVALIHEELSVRYFTPQILKIYSVKEKFGYSYWEAETTAGKVSFVLNNPFANIRVLEDQRIYISDMDGNSFVIPDPTALDRASYRRIEVYI